MSVSVGLFAYKALYQVVFTPCYRFIVRKCSTRQCWSWPIDVHLVSKSGLRPKALSAGRRLSAVCHTSLLLLLWVWLRDGGRVVLPSRAGGGRVPTRLRHRAPAPVSLPLGLPCVSYALPTLCALSYLSLQVLNECIEPLDLLVAEQELVEVQLEYLCEK